MGYYTDVLGEETEEQRIIDNYNYNISLRSRINNLSMEQRLNIKHIIIHHETPYTKNRNGIFLTMDGMSRECFKDVEKAVVMCEEYNEYMVQFNDKFSWRKDLKP